MSNPLFVLTVYTMIYYHIFPDSVSGDSYYRTNHNPCTQYVHPLDVRILHILLLESVPDKPFFCNHWKHFYVKSELKPEFESRFRELSFERIFQLTESYQTEPVQGFDRDSFWKMNIPSSGGISNFFLWEGRFLVVSEVALRFLVEYKCFKEFISYTEYGEAFQFVENKFEIGNSNIDHYFNERWKHIASDLVKKRQLATDEYRRRQGLPPLQR